MSVDEKNSRCVWAQNDPLMRTYHDTEWGVPIRDSRLLWETLMLEGFQVGLPGSSCFASAKRSAKPFSGFDPARVVRFGERDILRLMADPSIIRARAKIEATIRGAQETSTNGTASPSIFHLLGAPRTLLGDGYCHGSPVIEQRLWQTMTTIVRGSSVSCAFGRQRGPAFG